MVTASNPPKNFQTVDAFSLALHAMEIEGGNDIRGALILLMAATAVTLLECNENPAGAIAAAESMGPAMAELVGQVAEVHAQVTAELLRA